MITYQVDRTNLQKLNSEMKELSPVVAEIAPTLQTLLNLLNQHSSTINSPSIDSFRDELREILSKASQLTRSLTEDVQKLVSVSEQTGKHLAALEDHFGAVLRPSESENSETGIHEQF